MRTHRSWLARAPGWGLLLLLVIGVLAPPSFAHDSRSAQDPVVGPAPSRPDGQRLVVADLRRGSAAHVRRWPGRRITYTETIPAKWDWSLERALTAWNTAGGHLAFVKAKKGHRAQLVIGYGDTQDADGYATVGPARGAFVHLSPRYKQVQDSAEMKVWVGRLFTHELGHVVGFEHTQGKCSLMVAIFDFGACPVLDKDPGYYYCRWIDKPLLKRFVGAYGGKAEQAPKKCLIDPLPGQLGNAQFSGGTTGPVTLRWSPPSSAPPGSKVHVEVWAGACTSDPPRDLDVDLPLGAGSWTDPSDGTGGPHCFRAQVVNQYGAGPAPLTTALNRYQAPVATPTVVAGGWDQTNHQWAFSATWPANTTLVAYVKFTDPATCVAPGAPGTGTFSFDHGDVLVLPGDAPSECASFVARSSGGVLSTPVPVHFQAPVPPAPTLLGPVTVVDADIGEFSLAVQPVEGYVAEAAVRAGGCGGSPPSDSEFFQSPEDFFVDTHGANCVFVRLIDPRFSTWHGPPGTASFTWP